jgi:hypothetical protein
MADSCPCVTSSSLHTPDVVEATVKPLCITWHAGRRCGCFHPCREGRASELRVWKDSVSQLLGLWSAPGSFICARMKGPNI